MCRFRPAGHPNSSLFSVRAQVGLRVTPRNHAVCRLRFALHHTWRWGFERTLIVSSFSQLAIDVRRVFITENETNFLALPNVPGAIAIFGSGYGWGALAQAWWLEQCAIHYWGDIDTHGFAILDQLRSHFSHVDSFLMDRASLDAHVSFWGREDKQQRGDLHRLTPEELSLYNDLRDNRIREGLRLEQEHLSFGWVQERIDQLLQQD